MTDEGANSTSEERGYWGGSDGRLSPKLTARELGWYGDVKRLVTRTYDSDGTARYRVTDQRGQRVVRACLICLQVRPLRLSHVHPRWTGRGHQEEGGHVRGYRDTTGEAMHTEQDYAKHYLLCEECEQYVSESERYASLLSRGQPADLARIGAIRHEDNRVEGLNRKLRMRFAASFLLRSHGAASAPHIRLQHALATEVRTAIVQDNYPSSRHQLSIGRVYTAARGVNARAHAIRYVEDTLGVFRFEVLLGGLYLVYIVCPPERRQKRWAEDPARLLFEPLSVGESDLLFLPVELFDLNIFKIDVTNGLDLEVELPPLELDEPCPCGWGVGDLRSCCGPTWLREIVGAH